MGQAAAAKERKSTFKGVPPFKNLSFDDYGSSRGSSRPGSAKNSGSRPGSAISRPGSAKQDADFDGHNFFDQDVAGGDSICQVDLDMEVIAQAQQNLLASVDSSSGVEA